MPVNYDVEHHMSGQNRKMCIRDRFISTWGDSSVIVLLANGNDTEPKAGRKTRWFALTLLVLMIVGATVGELPFMEELFPGIDLDMFFFAAITTMCIRDSFILCFNVRRRR